MNLEFMTIGIEKVERFAGAGVELPFLGIVDEELFAQGVKFLRRNDEGNMGVGRVVGRFRSGLVESQADPEVTGPQVGALVPSHEGLEADQIRIKMEGTFQVGYGKGDMAESRDHSCH